MYNMMRQYFRNDALMSNFFLKALMVLTLTQQIYFPQKHSYYHLGLLFVYMIFIDTYDEAKRQVKLEWPFMGAVLLTTLVSFAEKLMPVNLELAYFAALALAIGLTGRMLLELISVLRDGQQHHRIAARNQKLLKRPKFVIGLLYALEAILGISLGYIIYLAILALI